MSKKIDAAKGTGKEAGKVSFIHSISFKVALIVVIASLVCILANVINAGIKVKSTLRGIDQQYIQSMAASAAMSISALPLNQRNESTYSSILRGTKISGLDSCVGCMVDGDGAIVTHPDADKVGQKLKNQQLLDIAAQLKADVMVKNGMISYDDQGEKIYAAYAATARKMLIVVSVKEEDILKPVRSIIKSMAGISAASAFLCLLAALFLGRLICRPIARLTTVIADTAQLNFKKNRYSEKLCKRKDETGKMAREVRLMRNQLRQMMYDIEEAGGHITNNVKELQNVTETIDNMCSDNSSTSEQLAAGMQETAATTVTINENVGMIKGSTEGLNTMASEGVETSKEVIDRRAHV